ncbi:hypothetical protein [Microbacterium sp.]|uniref:hypothetical protein n=1 Tax=Microbacterium sp. TaxID=51671 RepID=UPI003A905390
MNFADTLRGLLRRWYIVVPGLILAVVMAFGAFTVVKPGYERTATQLLLPGEGTVPAGTTNPYLFLGGLTQAADIVARVMNSQQGIGAVAEKYPGIEVTVVRDPVMAGPVISTTVTAQSDADAGAALDELIATTTRVLHDLQIEQKVKTVDQMSITTLTQDQKSTLQQKSRFMITAGVGLAIIVLTLIVASLVDGLARRARRHGRQGGNLAEPGTSEHDPGPQDADDDLLTDLADADAELGRLASDGQVPSFAPTDGEPVGASAARGARVGRESPGGRPAADD